MSENTISNEQYRVVLAETVKRKEQNRRLANELADAKKQLADAQAKHAADLGEKNKVIAQYEDSLSGQDALLKELEIESFDDLVDNYIAISSHLNAIGDDPQYQSLTKQIEELQGTIRDGKHRDVFNAKAKSLGFNPDALADVWEMSGYKADSEDIDESAMEAALTDLKGRKSWLLKPAENAPSNGATETAASNGKTPTAQGTGSATAAEVAPVGAKTLTLNAANPGAGAGRGTPEQPGKNLVSVEDRVNAAFAATGRTDAFKL